jgi:hypothetical protein
VTTVRQSELVHNQQTVLCSSSPLSTADVNALQVRRNQSYSANQSAGSKHKGLHRHEQTSFSVPRSVEGPFKYKWCGSNESPIVAPTVKPNWLPAIFSTPGHYSSVCRFKTYYMSVQVIHTAQSQHSVPVIQSANSEADALFVDTVVASAGQSQSRFADVDVDNATVHFRLDMGQTPRLFRSTSTKSYSARRCFRSTRCCWDEIGRRLTPSVVFRLYS